MQRKRPRPAGDGPAGAFTLLDPALASAPPQVAAAPAEDASGTDASLDWQQKIARMQEDGLLNPVQAGEMDRFFAERQALVNARMPQIEREFLQRRERDGNERAMAWLRDTKQQLQRDQYEATRQMLERMGLSGEELS